MTRNYAADLYPPVTAPNIPPTWEDIERLALHYPAVHHAVTLHRRGDLTREEALILAVYALADAFQKLFTAEVERRMNTPPDPWRPLPVAPPADPKER